MVHSAVTGFSGESLISCCFTRADALAISTARAAVDFDGRPAQIVGGSKTPGTIGNDAYTDTQRLRIRRAADFAVLG